MTKLRKLLTMMLVALTTTIPINVFATYTTYTAKTSTNFTAAFESFKNQYSIFITIFMSIMLLTSIGIFIYHCAMLALRADNAHGRAETIKNLLTTGICLSAQSAVSLIIALLFWGFY